MTYKDQFVVEIKCRGKILRVTDDIAYLPFGSEYSLYLKNLNSKRAGVKISIDGEDVLDYQSLILEANSSTELEGFLRGIIAKNRFKFINKTKDIQDHRGDKIDDGIIRVEFAFEKAEIKKTIIHNSWNYDDFFTGNSQVNYRSVSNVSAKGGAAFSSNVTMDSLGVQSLGAPLSDEGITVKGSECNQSFRYGSMGELEPAEVIVIRLKGITGSQTPIQCPITVKTKLTCSTCGKVSKSTAKFCSTCGTFLE